MTRPHNGQMSSGKSKSRQAAGRTTCREPPSRDTEETLNEFFTQNGAGLDSCWGFDNDVGGTDSTEGVGGTGATGGAGGADNACDLHASNGMLSNGPGEDIVQGSVTSNTGSGGSGSGSVNGYGGGIGIGIGSGSGSGSGGDSSSGGRIDGTSSSGGSGGHDGHPPEVSIPVAVALAVAVPPVAASASCIAVPFENTGPVGPSSQAVGTFRRGGWSWSQCCLRVLEGIWAEFSITMALSIVVTTVAIGIPLLGFFGPKLQSVAGAMLKRAIGLLGTGTDFAMLISCDWLRS